MIRKRLLAAVLSLVTAAAWADGSTQTQAAPVQKDSAANARMAGGNAASASNDDVVKVLRTTNKAQTNKYVCAAFRMDHVNPYDVINFFWAATSREEGGIYSFVHPTQPKGYIVVICPEYQLASLRKLAHDLDRPQLTSAPGTKYIYYRLRHRNVSDPGFQKILTYYEGASGTVLPDIETNSILIYDAPEGANATQEALDKFIDQPLTQVELDVHLYEMDVHNDAALGLDYEAWKNGPGQNLGQFSSMGRNFKASGTGTISSSETGSGIFVDYPSAFFDFLCDKGKARTLVNTKLAALNGVPALLTTGDQFLYYAVENGDNGRTVTGKTTDVATSGMTFPTDGKTFSGVDSPNGGSGLRGTIRMPFRSPDTDGSYPQGQYPQNNRPISSQIESADTGVTLGLVPTIGEKMVNLDLNLKVVDVNGFDNSGAPLLNSRQMKDAISLGYGNEMLFGGITRTETIQTTAKVPLLGTLPGIGYLFGHEITTKSKKLIVASVTPRLVTGSNNITPADDKLTKQANDEEVVVLPQSQFCFDQSVAIHY